MESFEVPDFTARAEQLRSGLKEFAGIFASYHTALVEHGFTSKEALELTVGCQEVVLTSLFEKPDED